MLMFMLVTPIVHMYVYLYVTLSPKFASSHFKQTRDPIMSIVDETSCLLFLPFLAALLGDCSSDKTGQFNF